MPLKMSRLGSAATAALLAGLAACGSEGRPTGDPHGAPDLERITVHGVAALVDEHLGPRNIEQYGTYGGDEESVGVMVELRGADRRAMFAVEVGSPEGAEGASAGGERVGCAQMEGLPGRRAGRAWCEELDGGGVAVVQLLPHGFSDDNRHGRVLMGMAGQPGARFVTVMYESYTGTVPVDPEDLLALLLDERLAWSTDPAVNEAGRDIDVRRLAGG